MVSAGDNVTAGWCHVRWQALYSKPLDLPLSQEMLHTYSWLQYAVLTISLGYFLYDTAVCFILDRDPWNAAHHLCTILGLLVGVCNRMVS